MLPVQSYRLYVDDGYGKDFSLILDSLIDEHLATNLTAGIAYSFKLTAVNFNGESEQSDISIIKACIAPYGV